MARSLLLAPRLWLPCQVVTQHGAFMAQRSQENQPEWEQAVESFHIMKEAFDKANAIIRKYQQRPRQELNPADLKACKASVSAFNVSLKYIRSARKRKAGDVS